MSCSQVRLELPAYLADTLPEDERKRWREHVAGCAACGQWLWREDGVLALSLRLPQAQPGDDRFVDEVLAGLHQRRVEKALARRKRALRRVAAAAAVLVALGLGYARWSRVEAPETVATPAAPVVAPEPFVEVEGEGVRVYQLAAGSEARVQVAFIVSPSVEL